MEKRNGKQIGDPAKAAKAMYEFAVMQDPPLRVVVGTDAYKAVMNKIDAYEKNYKVSQFPVRAPLSCIVYSPLEKNSLGLCGPGVQKEKRFGPFGGLLVISGLANNLTCVEIWPLSPGHPFVPGKRFPFYPTSLVSLKPLRLIVALTCIVLYNRNTSPSAIALISKMVRRLRKGGDVWGWTGGDRAGQVGRDETRLDTFGDDGGNDDLHQLLVRMVALQCESCRSCKRQPRKGQLRRAQLSSAQLSCSPLSSSASLLLCFSTLSSKPHAPSKPNCSKEFLTVSPWQLLQNRFPRSSAHRTMPAWPAWPGWKPVHGVDGGGKAPDAADPPS